MKTDICLRGNLFTVKYDWDDDARTNTRITSIHINGSADLYEELKESVVDELLDKLQAELKDK